MAVKQPVGLFCILSSNRRGEVLPRKEIYFLAIRISLAGSICFIASGSMEVN